MLEAKILSLKEQQSRLAGELSELACNEKNTVSSTPHQAPASESPGTYPAHADLCKSKMAAPAPQSVSLLMRQHETQKKDARSIRRPLDVPKEDSLSEWSQELHVESAPDELIHTRFRDMMEIKKNHLASAQLAFAETKAQLDKKTADLLHLSLSISTFAEHVQKLQQDDDVRHTVRILAER